MNVEDSYEGAVRRLRSLERAGVDLAPPATFSTREGEKEAQTRTRELEHLATIACDENERLERELADARERIDGLERLVATLRETLAGPDDQADLFPTRRGRGPLFYLFFLALLGSAGAALFILRPWEQLQRASWLAVTPPPAAAPEPIAPPVVAAPPTIPKVEPSHIEEAVTPPPTQPAPRASEPSKVETDRPRAAGPKHRPAKHHRRSEKQHRSTARAADHADASPRTNDPLGGLSL